MLVFFVISIITVSVTKCYKNKQSLWNGNKSEDIHTL